MNAEALCFRERTDEILVLRRIVWFCGKLGIHSRPMIYLVSFNCVAWKQWGERSTAKFKSVLEFVFDHLYLSLWLLAASLSPVSLRRASHARLNSTETRSVWAHSDER